MLDRRETIKKICSSRRAIFISPLLSGPPSFLPARLPGIIQQKRGEEKKRGQGRREREIVASVPPPPVLPLLNLHPKYVRSSSSSPPLLPALQL